jgi:hypothetical protein
MTSGAIVVAIAMVVMLIGALPTWKHSRGWGYSPSGGIGFMLVVLILLMLFGSF